MRFINWIKDHLHIVIPISGILLLTSATGVGIAIESGNSAILGALKGLGWGCGICILVAGMGGVGCD